LNLFGWEALLNLIIYGDREEEYYG
jgi:hypothetical protein